jgi:hypothetical protein
VRRFSPIIVLFLIGLNTTVWAATPMEVVQGPIDEIARLLKDPKYWVAPTKVSSGIKFG